MNNLNLTISRLNYLNPVYGLSTEGQWSLGPDGAYTRPCGYAERSFYWDAVHNGNVDAFENISVDVREGVAVQDIFNRQNVIRAWTHMKQLYPLLGAQIEEHDGHIRFIVFEKDLHTVRPDELIFKQVRSDKQACDMLLEVANAKRTLSPRHPVRVYILTCSDVPQRVHILYQVAHAVSDGTAQATLKTAFLDLLAKERPFTHRLEDRLALSVSNDTLWLKNPQNSPRQRWRFAIAAVMSRLRPLCGGHTIPQKVTTATPYSTVISARATIVIAPEASFKMLAGCKRIGVKFGTVLSVIGQIAATRLLFRHYMQGKISKEEWEFRKREPMLTSGPLNIRSMLDQNWYEDDGKSHICVAIAYFAFALPFMPLGQLANAEPSATTQIPPFSSFMSMKRFALRCQLAKRQLQNYVDHPLFFEKWVSSFIAKGQGSKEGAIRWRAEQEKPEELRIKGDVIPPTELSQRGPVWTHSGSSFGATDHLYLTKFPLDLKPGEEPLLKYACERNEIQVHVRPAQLYLSSTFGQGKMYLFIHWDTNVYEEDIVKEYLEEIRGAAEWYLASGGQGPESRAKL